MLVKSNLTQRVIMAVYRCTNNIQSRLLYYLLILIDFVPELVSRNTQWYFEEHDIRLGCAFGRISRFSAVYFL
ncbi:MAG: hypothetical protein MJK14_16610 [Rivularia sp. ALOHA_DT_140]|nr:hypothetical protein [Rivularia sp. ALOHA_DT_140]